MKPTSSDLQALLRSVKESLTILSRRLKSPNPDKTSQMHIQSLFKVPQAISKSFL